MSKKNTTTPHDGLFKVFLTTPDTAKDMLEIHLPTHLKTLCDLSTLKLESGSFLEDDLRPYYSDVLYSMKTEGFVAKNLVSAQNPFFPDLIERLNDQS